MKECMSCGASDSDVPLQYQFTKRLKEITAKDTRRHSKTRQPSLYCAKCSRKFPNVSPLDGHVMRPQVKSYVLRDGELVPMRKADQYHDR